MYQSRDFRLKADVPAGRISSHDRLNIGYGNRIGSPANNQEVKKILEEVKSKYANYNQSSGYDKLRI